MNISKAAKAAGLPVKTVRYIGNIDLVAAQQRSASGYRLYDDRSLRKLIFVRRTRSFGFSIEACRDLLDLYHDSGRSGFDVKRLADGRLTNIDQKQHDLQSLLDDLSHLIHAWRGDQRPECPILEYLA
ncbi:MAG TPA: heavy metal-responsive transcriptional regulator [Rhodobacteraceae bacterium]|nr:heavy metal-responsive transcriptional regulator [Paracoccaceae bacterium]